ncbi:MAG: conjugal transfer protein TraF [Nautiliaceae bacterium]
MKKLVTLSLITALTLSAFEFEPLGFRSIGMGGAGVANASGSTAPYYNPALLGLNRYSAEFALNAGVGVREINLITHLDNLANKYYLTRTIDVIKEHAPISGSNRADPYRADLKIQGALNEIYKLSQGNGLTIEPTVAFAGQVRNFGLGVYGLGELEANAVIERQHLYLIFSDNKGGYYYYYPKTDTYGATDKETYKEYSLEYALDNNLTYVNVNGIALIEVPFTYAYTFSIPGADVSVGANLKYIQGITYKDKLTLDTSGDSLNKSLDKNKKESSNFGLDLGILVKADKMRIGLVGKYLNSPKFKYYDGSKITIKPMVRGGVAIDALDWLTFAMDVDVTENSTNIPNYKSQYLGGGVDIHPNSWFSIRAGAMRNMVQDEEGLILTGGVGLGLKWFQLDLAAQASTKTATFDGNTIPRYFKINLALVSRWGG